LADKPDGRPAVDTFRQGERRVVLERQYLMLVRLAARYSVVLPHLAGQKSRSRQQVGVITDSAAARADQG
jgi:hypothetical protein